MAITTGDRELDERATAHPRTERKDRPQSADVAPAVRQARAPAPLPVRAALALQRAAGNRAVTTLVRPPTSAPPEDEHAAPTEDQPERVAGDTAVAPSAPAPPPVGGDDRRTEPAAAGVGEALTVPGATVPVFADGAVPRTDVPSATGTATGTEASGAGTAPVALAGPTVDGGVAPGASAGPVGADAAATQAGGAGVEAAPAVGAAGRDTVPETGGGATAGASVPAATATEGTAGTPVAGGGATTGGSAPAPAGRAGVLDAPAGAAAAEAGPAGAPAAPAPQAVVPVEVPADLLAHPELGEATVRVEEAVTRQHSALHAATDAEIAAVDAHAALALARLGPAAAQFQQAIDAQVAGRRAVLTATAAAVRGRLSAQAQAQRAGAVTAVRAAHGRLDAGVVEKQRAARSAAELEAREARQGGHTEAARALRDARETTTRIDAVATRHATVQDDDGDVREAVHEAVWEAAREITGEIRDRGTELADRASTATAEFADGLAGKGEELARSLTQHTGQVHGQLDQLSEQAIGALGTQSGQQLAHVGTVVTEATAALDQAAAVLRQQVAGQLGTAAREILAARDTARQALQDGAERRHAQLTTARNAAVGQLVDAAGARRRAAGARDFADAAVGLIDEAGSGLVAGVSHQRESAVGRLDAVTDSFAASGAATVGRAAVLDSVVDGVTGGLAQLQAGAAGQNQQVVAELRSGMDQATTDYLAGLGEQIAQSRAAWQTERQEVVGKVRSEVDEGLAKNRETESRADTELGNVARQAAEDARASWWEKVGSGIWNAIKKFVPGLLLFLAIAVGVWLVLAAVGILALTFKGFLIAAMIVGLVFMAYAFVNAIITRWGEYTSALGDQPWYIDVLVTPYIVAVAAGDVVGVSQLVEGISGHNLITFDELSVEERAEKVTEGILIIGTLLLFRAAVRRAGPVLPEGLGPRGRRIGERLGEERTTTPAADVYARLGERFNLRPDIVEMLRDSGADPVVVERLLARGVDAERVALASDLYGPDALRALDALTRTGVPENTAGEIVANAASMDNLRIVAELADSGLLARLQRRGFNPDELVLLADEVHRPGMETIDALTQAGVEKAPAIEAARIAQRIGAEAEVRQLTTSGNLDNPGGLRRFLREVDAEVAAGQRGKLTQLQEAARRSESERVSIERSQQPEGQADIIGHGTREAVQMKVVTSRSPTAVADNARSAARQLRGEPVRPGGEVEVPPQGYSRIADVRIESPDNPMYRLDRAGLRDALVEEGITADSLRGVDQLRVTNGTGTHTFTPADF